MTAGPLAAEVARDITWDSLVPQLTPLDNPFSELSYEQIYELSLIAILRQDIADAGLSEVSAEAEEVLELTTKLTSEGLEVDKMVAKKMLFDAEVARRNASVVGDLEGQLVRLPGYVLPLEFSEVGVKEFLLVPYIGACIHVPPPPPNQMVFVRLDETFAADGLYRPVWVTGRMKVEAMSSALSFVDGQAPVASSYVLDGMTVEPYN